MRSQLVQSTTGLRQLLRSTSVASYLWEESLKSWRTGPAANQRQDSSNLSQSPSLMGGWSLLGDRSDNSNRFRSKSKSMGDLGERRLYSIQAASKEGLEATGDIHVKIEVPYQLHMLEDGPAQEIRTSKEESMEMYRNMMTIRRFEILADMLFKSQFVRGFCHLCDGQEAVSVGMEAALTYEDAILTAYRDHGNYLVRGGTIFEAFSELMGKKTGAAIGKGGSMHLYKKENNFYGGWGIVGTSGSLGTGVGFALKYLKKQNVSVAVYGDGAANQGQLFEAQNLAALWNLPVIYLVENNHYGMGTAEWRASKKTTFYDRLSYIPGIKMDGMDVFAVKSAFLYAKAHCLDGKGPIVLEADTYRYHGHSMSDPGRSYRDRSEIQGVRKARDPIEHLKTIILQEGLCSAEELKSIDKEIRRRVEEAGEKAKEAPYPDEPELFSNIYKKDTGLVTYGCDRNKKVQLP
ncbi:unnamed protein product [Calypogeia fissa]